MDHGQHAIGRSQIGRFQIGRGILGEPSEAHEIFERFVSHFREDGDVGEGLGGRIGEHGMQKDIDHRHLLDHLHLALDGLQHGLAGVREDHVADGGDASGSGGFCAGLVVVAPLRFVGGYILPERNMDVRVHAARHDKESGRVDLAIALQVCADLGDRFSGDSDVGTVRFTGGDNRSTANDEIVRHWNLLRTKNGKRFRASRMLPSLLGFGYLVAAL